MKIAFLADPLETFKTYKDSTYAMMREAARAGTPSTPSSRATWRWSGVVTANAFKITLTGDADDWYRADEPARATSPSSTR
jgi:glutathione synthase